MPQMNPAQLCAEWQQLRSESSVAARQALRALAESHSEELARYFYEQMLTNALAATFLDHQQVKSRLSRTMGEWVVSVFSADSEAELLEVIALQQKVGQIHARIEVPVSLVLRGVRWLKKRLRQLLEQAPQAPEVRQGALQLGHHIIDLAIEIMCFAFSQSHDRNSRAEEAYRLFSVSQNIGAEKERQRAALLDWENQLMFALTIGDPGSGLKTLQSSEFGMWFRHKASHAFQGAPEASSILEHLVAIDSQLSLLYRPEGIDLELLRKVREQTKAVKFLLDSLFEQANHLEAGRDVLTRLLNRKFLPVVMTKEINYSRQSGNHFGVLAIDVDHFKQINDRHGHDGGDAVLQQLAAVLASNVRGGDYAFRLGGEEFLIVLVDIDAEGAMQVAEKLRLQIERERFSLNNGTPLQITASIGVALHNGHPDYERLLLRADQGLYQAKAQGRNRCVML